MYTYVKNIYIYNIYIYNTCIASFDPSNMDNSIIPISRFFDFCVQPLAAVAFLPPVRLWPHGLCRKIWRKAGLFAAQPGGSGVKKWWKFNNLVVVYRVPCSKKQVVLIPLLEMVKITRNLRLCGKSLWPKKTWRKKLEKTSHTHTHTQSIRKHRCQTESCDDKQQKPRNNTIRIQ